jgi:hypothetical protein
LVPASHWYVQYDIAIDAAHYFVHKLLISQHKLSYSNIFLLHMFYCSVFTMVQGDFSEVLEVVAYDEKLTQIDRGTIL